MASKTEYVKIAKEIFESLGERENISSVAHCMTRLRVIVRDEEKVNEENIKKIEGVMGLVKQGDQIQVILGPGKVARVANEFGKISGLKIGELDEAEIRHEEIRQKNATPFKLFLRKLSNIFIPLIPAFIACGLIMGINNIIVKATNGAFAETLISTIFSDIGSSVFVGLNTFVGITTAKEFGGSPILGGIIAITISSTSLAEIVIKGKPLVSGTVGIITVLLVVVFSSWLERKLRDVIPENLDLLLTPLIVVLVSSFAAIFLLQPLGGIISEAIGNAVKVSIKEGGAITGFILGGTFLPLVMTGLHQGLTPIHAELLKTTGQNLLLPILAMAGAGQVGASIAVLVKTKNKRLKKTVKLALPVGIMGIGEPLIYGVTLPLGKPFLGACIGGAFGGAVQAGLKVAVLSMGISGLPLAAVATNPLKYLLGILVSYVAGFIATYLLGFEDPLE